MPGLQVIKVRPTAWLVFALLTALASVLASRLLHTGAPASALTGVAIAILHWVALAVHHLGHSMAARRTGYPMIGILLWWGLATSLYPRDEPDLPAHIHIRRALGGPTASLAFAALAAAIACTLRPGGDHLWIFPAFAAADSLVIFGVGSLLPLGFNDGSTLIRWSRAHRQDRAA